jgi:hypothetical protein
VVFNRARLSPRPLRRDACSALSDARRVTTPDAEAYRLGADLEANR